MISKISLTYEGVRELLEALANGYKIYNRECYTPFLKLLGQEQLAEKFDATRKI